MKNIQIKNGFTLAETMIVLVVLGLVAAITVPNVFRRYQESLARTKIKKCMTIYDMFISKSAIDNDFRSENEFNNWAKADGCRNVRRFFDVIEEDGCRFVTKDKVHWDFTEPMKPVIALNDDAWDSYLESGETDGIWSFGFVVTYDPKTGSFRVNDLAYEINRLKEELLLADEDSKADIQAKIDELEKLYGFLNNIKVTNGSDNNETVCNDGDLWCQLLKTDRMKSLCPSGDIYDCVLETIECEEGTCFGLFTAGYDCSGNTLSTCEHVGFSFCADEDCDSFAEYSCNSHPTSFDDCSPTRAYTHNRDVVIDKIKYSLGTYCDTENGCTYSFWNNKFGLFGCNKEDINSCNGCFYDSVDGIDICKNKGFSECSSDGCCKTGLHYVANKETCESD